MPTPSLQETYAPQNQCFGCGPANTQGLRLRSIPAGAEVVCDWQPQPHHLAFEGMLNGGICGALLDCHSNWTAAWHLQQQRGLETPPCTVTAEFHVKLRRPTPMGAPVHLRAWVVESEGDRVTVDCELTAVMPDGAQKVTSTCRGVFVAVREGHPAFHRW